MGISRRKFLGTSAAAAAALTLDRSAQAATPRISVVDRTLALQAVSRPVIVASANGIRGVARAYEMITRQNTDTLDAIIAGVNIQELDPEDQSVGLGGLPNEEGVVQLDASCMHGPTKRAGSVGCLEGIATPSLVAKAVMDYTDHIMLVGHDAKRFALAMGFKEMDLLTEKSKQDWLKWKATRKPDPWISDKARADWLKWNANKGNKAEQEDLASAGDGEVNYTYGTINMDAVNANGDVSSCTT